MTLAPEVYKQVVGTITDWLRRQRSGIKVEIDGHVLEGQVSREQRDSIVAAYLKRIGAEENRSRAKHLSAGYPDVAEDEPDSIGRLLQLSQDLLGALA